MTVLIDIARFVFVFGLAVVIHEFGHLIVAKWCGARVHVFSVGFGKRLCGFKWGETEYQIAAVPVGGYVKIAGMDPDEELTGASWEFLSISPWGRIAILFAGPAMNVVLALAIYYVLFVFVGQPVTPTTTLGIVPEGSPGWEMGLHSGDRILAVNGREVGNWDEFENLMLASPTDEIEIEIQRGEEKLIKIYPADLKPLAVAEGVAEEKELAAATLDEEEETELPPPYDAEGFVVSAVLPGGAADRAGLTPNSVITRVGDKNAIAIEDLPSAIAAHVRTNGSGEPEIDPIQITWVEPDGTEETAEFHPDIYLPADDAIPYRSVPRLGLAYKPLRSLEDFFLPGAAPLNVSPRLKPVVGVVKERSPAERAGLERGDEIVMLDGEPLEDWNVLQLKVLNNYEREGEEYVGIPVALTWRDGGGNYQSATIAPDVREEIVPTDRGIRTGEKVPFAGIGIQRLSERQRLGIIGAAPMAVQNVKNTFETMIGLIGRVFQGTASRKVFGGPIAIFQFSAETGQWGLERFFGFIAMLSVSLAFLNLLPIPALDGGHILLTSVELIRRKPMTLQQMEFWGRIGVYLFILPLMVFMIFNDLDRVGLFTKIGDAFRWIFSAMG